MRKVIYSLKVATELFARGYRPVVKMPNPRFPKYDCWVFEVTDEFARDVDEVLRSV